MTESTIWVGNGTIAAMPGCCPNCAMFHDGARAEQLCRLLARARGGIAQAAAFRLLANAIRDEQWDRGELTRRTED